MLLKRGIYKQEEIISRRRAIELGLKTYFTGKPCKNGHISYRFTKWRNCAECSSGNSRKYYKASSEVRRDKYIKNVAWKKANPKRYRELARAGLARYRTNSREKYIAAKSRWRANKLGAGGSYTAAEVVGLRARQKRCASCKRIFCRKRPSYLDHIIALNAGGSNNFQNLQLLCKPCNSAKRDRRYDPTTGQGILL